MKTDTKLAKKLSRRLFLQLISSLVLYTLAGVAIYGAASLMLGMFTWQGTEPIYIAASWLNSRRVFFAQVYILVGYVLIIRHYWNRPFSYFQQVAEATRQVYNKEDALVELSPELSELENQLNQIKLTAAASERAAREAEQRKNDLVTYLAHDLKTPITSVIGYLTLLRDEQDLSPEMRQRYQSIALEKAERLDDLINEFFDITRFNLTHISLDRQVINLSLMLQQLVSEFAPMLTEKKLRCTIDAPDGIMMRCDPDKLQRVFDNLLRNAVAYSYENSVIRISACPGADSVQLCFENDGDTIAPEKLARIFEQFYRLDTSRGTKSGGAGLGLAIAKEIVELHGGTIRAVSRDQKVRFEVVLPL